jgi:hypothetical protein
MLTLIQTALQQDHEGATLGLTVSSEGELHTPTVAIGPQTTSQHVRNEGRFTKKAVANYSR